MSACFAPPAQVSRRLQPLGTTQLGRLLRGSQRHVLRQSPRRQRFNCCCRWPISTSTATRQRPSAQTLALASSRVNQARTASAASRDSARQAFTARATSWQRLRVLHHVPPATTGTNTYVVRQKPVGYRMTSFLLTMVVCEPLLHSPVGTADYKRHPCTAKDSYCQIGSERPSTVDPGYFTVTTSNSNVNNALFQLRVDQTVCPLGSFCIDGIAHLCPPGTFDATSGLQTRECSGQCQAGYTCTLGSVSATQSPCPAGSYALPSGVACAPCAPGYWCETASPSPDQHTCGSDDAFCPLGSALPTSVSDGFFATGQQTLTHTSQQGCSPRNAAHVLQCPSRTVGSLAGL